MKYNALFSKALPLLLLLNASSTIASEKLAGYKVAIIKDSVGSESISKGLYKKGIDELSSSSINSNRYDTAMNLCVAQIKSTELDLAEKSCTKAIDAISLKVSRSRHGKILTAFAYSNRAIAKQLNNKSLAAYDDFTVASSIIESDIVASNFAYFKESFAKPDVANVSETTTAD